MGSVDYHSVFRALTRVMTECGDIAFVRIYDNLCFLGLVDALGYGPNAYRIACLAKKYLEQHFGDDLGALIRGLHEHLKGTNGAVAALCRLNINTGEICYVGIGNITVKVIGPRAFTFVPRDGVVGYLMPSPTKRYHKLFIRDILLMYSDGIRHNFDSLDCVDLFSGSAEKIATGILDKFGKQDDDASCIALRLLT